LEARRAAALRDVIRGFQQNYLDDLAVFATTTANTALSDSNARRSVSETMRLLEADGQITITTQPDVLLDTLVSNHVLMRSGDTPGYSFQHQQFQEWYASHRVELLMLQAVSGTTARERLRSEILNERPWEEAVLFAVERTARGDAAQKAACSAAILCAFEVDPVLAAEMIFRATDDVWRPISAEIRGFVEKWHTPGKIDRAVGFMIASGRPDFADLIWPLITHKNDQVHLSALRAARRFRPSVLGSGAPERIAQLPLETRKNVLFEIASKCGTDGIDLATTLAKIDSDPNVKVAVADALSFRRADRPAATSAEAEAIFGVIDRLLVEGATDDQKNLAVVLGIVGARLPHGERDATIEELIALAPRQSRAALLLGLVLSGEEIDIKLVSDGIASTFEAAKKEPWILTDSDGYQLRAWLRLLPFVNHVAEVTSVVRGIPDAQRVPDMLKEVVRGLGDAPSGEAEDVLFKLAEDDQRFYLNHQWRATAMQLGTESAVRRLVELTARGTLGVGSMDNWHLARELGGFMREFPDVRKYVHELLKDGPKSKGLEILARAVAEAPDTEGLLLLIKIEIKHRRSFWTWLSIETVVTNHVPAENWKGAYNIVPVPAIEIRRQLLALTTDGGVNDAAARCLNAIDKIRDGYGAPECEPRHPDLASGRPWPMMRPDPDADHGE
jgi:hypothetical protein